LRLPRDHLAGAVNMAAFLVRRAVLALRILVDRSHSSWARRRFLGERIGVWLLAAIWIVLVVLALTVLG
jgi:hypothetical protein